MNLFRKKRTKLPQPTASEVSRQLEWEAAMEAYIRGCEYHLERIRKVQDFMDEHDSAVCDAISFLLSTDVGYHKAKLADGRRKWSKR